MRFQILSQVKLTARRRLDRIGRVQVGCAVFESEGLADVQSNAAGRLLSSISG
jgi:hypothetical protein